MFLVFFLWTLPYTLGREIRPFCLTCIIDRKHDGKPVIEVWMRAQKDRCPTALPSAQCAFRVVRWLSSQMAIAIKTLSHGKTIVLRLFFLYCFRKKTLKLVSLFIFRH